MESPKKQNLESNKNKFYSFLNKRKLTSSEIKDSKIKQNIPSNNQLNIHANYLNSKLKQEYNNTINKKINIQKKENNNLIYPKKVPKNFIPLYLFETINLDVNKNIIKQNKNELRDTLDLYNKQKNEIIKNEKEIQKTKEDIKKAKEARNIIMEEVFHIKKEIENKKENENINNNISNRSRLSVQIGKSNLLKYLESDEIKKIELDNDIRDIEEKISKLKFENKNFMEEYDILINDYRNNLNKNLKIKNFINDIEKRTKDALKEKEDLKKYIKRMGK